MVAERDRQCAATGGTAGPSTAPFAKCASGFAQDDKVEGVGGERTGCGNCKHRFLDIVQDGVVLVGTSRVVGCGHAHSLQERDEWGTSRFVRLQEAGEKRRSTNSRAGRS